MPNKNLTDNEIKKALECFANDDECIYEKYEEACGLWCELKHKWCEDMSGKSAKGSCAEHTPIFSMPIAKHALDLINRLETKNSNLTSDLTSLQNDLTSLKAENEKWQGGYMTQKEEIANLEIELKAMRGAANSYKAENESLKNAYKQCAWERDVFQTENERLTHITRNLIGEIKAEAYTEFAERLKSIIMWSPKNHISITAKDVEMILKEMVGEDNEK